MDQDSEEEKQQYLALALHLASEFFLRNPNKDVRLLVACCLADIFRIYAPEAPYTSHDKLKVWHVLLKGQTSYLTYDFINKLTSFLRLTNWSRTWTSCRAVVFPYPAHNHITQMKHRIEIISTVFLFFFKEVINFLFFHHLGNFSLHYTAVEGIRGYQEPSVQQIFLLTRGEMFHSISHSLFISFNHSFSS